METMQKCSLIGIVGTGDFGCALARRLLYNGFEIFMGSRNPSRRQLTAFDSIFSDVHLTTIEKCVGNPNIEIIFIAVQYHNLKDLLVPFKDLLREKILVDVSNRTKKSKTGSNAEELASQFPGARVVKGFNTLSAYELETNLFNGTRCVYLASDDNKARETVSCLTRDMGFCPVNAGVLSAAREIEAYPLQLMTGWGLPTSIACVVLLFWISLISLKECLIYIGNLQQPEYPWRKIPLSVLNWAVSLTAITLLGLTYLPGCLAAFLQLYNGTKYKRFPLWFDRWLKSRKMLGLYALLFSFWHVAISIIIVTPFSMPFLYVTEETLSNQSSFKIEGKRTLNIYSTTAFSVGVMSLLLMTVVGISTLPSVRLQLNWREWRFVQSYLGYATLFLVAIHVIVLSFPGWIGNPTSFFYWNSFLSCILPSLVLLMKSILTLPCIYNKVNDIRQGWERKTNQRERKTSEEIELI